MSVPQSTVEIPVEALADATPPGMQVPNTFRFSTDGSRVYFLAVPADDTRQHLYALDVTTGDVSTLAAPPDAGKGGRPLSQEEELQRQRERMLSAGITHYYRAMYHDRIVLPINGSVYVYDPAEGELRKLVDGADGKPVQNPRLSPDGEWVAYVWDAEVYVISAVGGEPIQVTTGGRESGKTNGLADYIAQEELGRSEGFWWSDDSAYIAFTEVDESPVKPYRIVHQGADVGEDVVEEVHRYPFAGETNAIVRLGVVARDGSDLMWMDLNTAFQDTYIGRVFWWPDNEVGVQLLNREQTVLELARFDRETGARHTVHKESNQYWVNLRHSHFMTLANGSFVWASERSGFNHLYLYDEEGALRTQLTSGEWMVDDLVMINEEQRCAYFTGNREHPTRKDLYRVSLDGGKITRVTPEQGTHEAVVAPHCRYFVDVYSSLSQPPRVWVRQLDEAATVQHDLSAFTVSRAERYPLEPPQIISLENREGATLYGAVYRPPASLGDGPFPVVVQVYGGPGPQLVSDEWKTTVALQAQYLRSKGYLVFRLDNRGSARRGIAFEGAIAGRMGTIEVEDQVDGVDWLISQGLAVPERVGIFGWSYGGYMTLMCLAKAPDTFKVGVAGAPVTYWEAYDTGYTERYMRLPESNPDGYANASVIPYVDNIRGKLLLVHGMLDENVHFRHSARLMRALNEARKSYDTLIFPEERHMLRHMPNRVYLNERMMGYFEQHL